MPPVNSSDRKKRYHQKDINGCHACKRRHTRCDLRRPSCYKCILTDQECSYDAPPPRAQDTPMSLVADSLTQTRVEDPHEKRALSYFMDRTRKDLAGFTSYTEKFWTVLIPQLTTTEPAFRHFAIAIALRHESLTAQSATKGQLELLCTRQHCCCLHLFSKLDASKNTDLLLLSCIGFIAFERLTDPTGMDARYLPYVVAGARILRERRSNFAESLTSGSGLIDTFVEPMFLQIELMFCIFCQPTSVLGDENSSETDCKPSIPTQFDCIKEARDTFVQICVWRYHPSILSKVWSRTSEAFASIWSLITDWQSTFAAMLRSVAEQRAEVQARAATLQQQVCLLTGALLYSTEPVASFKPVCYPALADLRTPSRLHIYVRLPSTRRINLTAINGSRLCNPADTEARILPRAKRVQGDGKIDSILLEFSR